MRGGFALNWHAGSDLISFFRGPHFVRTARGKKDHEFVARLRLHSKFMRPFCLSLARFESAECMVWEEVGSVVFPFGEPPSRPLIISVTPSRTQAPSRRLPGA